MPGAPEANPVQSRFPSLSRCYVADFLSARGWNDVPGPPSAANSSAGKLPRHPIVGVGWNAKLWDPERLYTCNYGSAGTGLV